MCCKTRQNTINQILGLTAVEILGPNPKRKAIIFMPSLGNADEDTLTVAEVIPAAGLQLWTVPTNVTTLLDIYGWSQGGHGGDGGAALGGGGGGGGAFARTGPLTVVPGTVFQINVPVTGGATDTTVQNPALTVVLWLVPGTNGNLNTKGVGGTVNTGQNGFIGGDGKTSTALAGVGGGGGGGAGSYEEGFDATTQAGALGGGTATLLTYGPGGNGGAGAAIAGNGVAGSFPGGGGGGAGKDSVVPGAGGDAAVVIFYLLPTASQIVSMSFRKDVVAGQGALNYAPDGGYKQIITDEDIGNVIGLPWWIISAIDQMPIQIVEVSYDE